MRLSSLGDVTHVVPVIRTLQRERPSARLTWIIGKVEHQLVGDIPGVEFLVFDKRAGWRAWRDLRRQLRSRRFDVLLLMQVALRANLLSGLVSARTRIGYDRARAREAHRFFVNRHVAPPPPGVQHVVDAFGSFLEPLGIQQTDVRWDIPIPAEATAWAEEQLPGSQPTLVISPCSSHARRNWHVAGYAAVADHAYERHGFRVALCGGRSATEQTMGAAIRAAVRAPVIDLMGKDTLKRLLAVLRRARVVLTPDSGPMHLANAVGTPVIGLHAATDSRRSGPYSDRRFCVDRFRDAALRYAGREPEKLRWGTRLERPGVMDLISTADVMAAFDLYVAAGGLPPR